MKCPFCDVEMELCEDEDGHYYHCLECEYEENA